MNTTQTGVSGAVEYSPASASLQQSNSSSDGCATTETRDSREAGIRLISVDFLVPVAALFMLNLAIVLGNILVITAVFTHAKLRRSTTNKFVVSLAVADLMVGLIVLPFSSVNEVLMYWPFGSEWCSVWLAVDVWLCTASIYNLCAISLDRYLAISRPFKYPRLMSPFRAKLLIVCVWILSFIICFPPLIGWNERKHALHRHFHDNTTDYFLRNPPLAEVHNDTTVFPMILLEYLRSESAVRSNCGDGGGMYPECTLTSDPGYIVYSALGSFWIPMFVMVGFYWKIYKTAESATEAFRRGFIEKRSTGANLSASSSENSITLRIHRGGSQSPIPAINQFPSDYVSPPLTRKSFDDRFQMACTPTLHRSDAERRRVYLKRSVPKIVVTSIHSSQEVIDSVTIDDGLTGSQPQLGRDSRLSSCSSGGGRGSYSESSNCLTEGRRKSSKFSKFQNLLPQLRSLNREKKAAKTVGVIVGCFIFCWVPFFSVYLAGAFCPGCTPSMLFDVCFWLGYCNSAANPFIYGLCSRDFRYAFKKLLRCRCERKKPLRREGSHFMTMLQSLRLQIVSRAVDSSA